MRSYAAMSNHETLKKVQPLLKLIIHQLHQDSIDFLSFQQAAISIISLSRTTCTCTLFDLSVLFAGRLGVMTRCWQEIPDHRPSFFVLAEELSTASAEEAEITLVPSLSFDSDSGTATTSLNCSRRVSRDCPSNAELDMCTSDSGVNTGCSMLESRTDASGYLAPITDPALEERGEASCRVLGYSMPLDAQATIICNEDVREGYDYPLPWWNINLVSILFDVPTQNMAVRIAHFNQLLLTQLLPANVCMSSTQSIWVSALRVDLVHACSANKAAAWPLFVNWLESCW